MHMRIHRHIVIQYYPIVCTCISTQLQAHTRVAGILGWQPQYRVLEARGANGGTPPSELIQGFLPSSPIGIGSDVHRFQIKLHDW